MNKKRLTAWLVADSKEEAIRTIEKLQKAITKIPDYADSININTWEEEVVCYKRTIFN